MRGQLTPVNLVVLFVTILLYSALYPIFQEAIDSAAVVMLAAGNPWTTLTVSLLYALPFFLLLAIVLTAVNYANPRREGVY